MTEGICIVDSCRKGGRMYRQMCAMHYKRLVRTGTTDRTGRHVYSTPDESFEARTEWRGDCLIWTGGKDASGYGSMWVGAGTDRSHRYAWKRENGPIPEGMDVDHMCHNRACANVRHLRLATRSENGQNRRGSEAGSSTGIRNVYPHKGTFRVVLWKGGKSFSYGCHSTAEEAAEVAAAARAELFGEFAGRG